MKIEALSLKNFKSFRNVEIANIPQYCIFVGANGVGKSSLFSVFRFLHDALNSNVTTALYNLGGDGGLTEVRSREAEGPIEITLKFRARFKRKY